MLRIPHQLLQLSQKEKELLGEVLPLESWCPGWIQGQGTLWALSAQGLICKKTSTPELHVILDPSSHFPCASATINKALKTHARSQAKILTLGNAPPA